MKSLLTLSLLLLSLTCSVGQRVSIWPEAAVGGSNIRPTQYDPDDVRHDASTSFEAGLVARIAAWRWLSVPVGVHFQQKGFHFKPESGVVFGFNELGQWAYFQTDRVGLRCQYLTLAPGVEAGFWKKRLGVSFSPFYSFRLSEGFKIYDHTGWKDANGDTFISKKDYGFEAGVHGYWRRLTLFAKWQHSLCTQKKYAITDESGAPLGSLYFRNRAAVAGLGYRLF